MRAPCTGHGSGAPPRRSVAADRRHRRSRRPRKDNARPRADGEGHRPAARGAGAWDLDRPRLRAARAPRRQVAVAGGRPRPRAVREDHGRRRDGDRPLSPRRRRRGGGPSADARAPRDPPASRRGARRRRRHEGGRGRPGDARARRPGGARARSRGGGRRGQRRDGHRAWTSCAPPSEGRRSPSSSDAPTFPPGCTSTACSRCGGSAPSSPGRCGRARSPKATISGSSRRAGTCACGRCRCTTHRSSGRTPAGGWR